MSDRIPVHQIENNGASFQDNRDLRGQLEASLKVVPPKVKTWEEIRDAVSALRADARAFYAAHKNPLADDYSDAVAGLCDALAHAEVEFASEVPTSTNPAEYYRAGGHGSI